MKNRAKIFTLSALAIIAASPLVAQKYNYYTEGNLTLGREPLEPEKSALQDEKSRMQQKRFEPKKFEAKDDGAGAKDFEKKRAEPKDGALAESYRQKKSDRYKKGYEAPELNRFEGGYDVPELNSIKNSGKNLSKKYEGSIDFSKRHYRDSEMREFLEKVNEKSMKDINKYMFRSSRSDEPGLPATEAGGQLGTADVKSNSIKDFIFGMKNMDRPAVSFSQNMEIGSVKSSKAMDIEEAKKTSAPPPNAKILPAKVIGESQAVKKPETPPERKVKVAETEVVLKSQGMFSPKDGAQKQSRYKIKVEVAPKEDE